MGQTITTDTETGAIIVAILAVCTALGMLQNPTVIANKVC